MSEMDRAVIEGEHEKKKLAMREYNRIKQQEHRDRLKEQGRALKAHTFVDTATSPCHLDQENSSESESDVCEMNDEETLTDPENSSEIDESEVCEINQEETLADQEN